MHKDSLPIIAIVGPPNAGKSTLMNKIAGKPLAVTSDVPGTTRDRQYVDVPWNGRSFTLVDTAGINLQNQDELEHNLHKQIDIAIAEADILLLVADARLAPGTIEQAVLQKFRKIKKPLLLAINKLDSPTHWNEKIGEFQALGIKKIFPVSAINGRGIGDLLDAIVENLPPDTGDYVEETDTDSISVSILGKPNVGKSSIFNFILQEERVVVSPIPGTTRTAIDSKLTIGDQKYTFIDTAGLKKKAYRQEQPDVFSGFQTFKSIRRSDVCFLVIDAVEEITKQDQRIASEIQSMEKGAIIIINKIDLYSKAAPDRRSGEALEKEDRIRRRGRDKIGHSGEDYSSLQDYISLHFPFLWMCPVFFVSAKTGQGLTEAIAAIKPIYENRKKVIDSEILTAFLERKLKTSPPKLLRDQKKPKVTGLRQVGTEPPTFELLVNHPAAISTQFRKFIENSLIKELDFWGTPITLRLKGKDKS